jgi:NAD(P)-dependent dehydrogenase (short-subunit alcohol dehydrogenase family)
LTFSPTALGIAGRVVVVTGAARGLGRAFAQGLAAGGARIVLLDVDGEGVDTAADELTRHGVEALGLHCDVAERESVDVAVARAVEAFGCIDGLVNNAGINQIAPSLEADPEEWRRVLTVNLFGAFLMSQSVGRVMTRQRSGSIVNIASIHAHVAPALHAASAYAASKTGLLGLTRALAVEWGDFGVRVNAIAPGFVLTDMTQRRLSDRAYLERILERSPLRQVVVPDDLIGAAYYLLSDAARMVTGQSLGVDVGWLAV